MDDSEAIEQLRSPLGVKPCFHDGLQTFAHLRSERVGGCVVIRVNALKGEGAGGYYTVGLPSYYLDGEEPPGIWWGKATDRLGLDGPIDSEDFLAVMAGQDPATGMDLGRKFGEKSVRGYDATFSAPKSVSLLWALGDELGMSTRFGPTVLV